jgi:protein-disulfide isomerase
MLNRGGWSLVKSVSSMFARLGSVAVVAMLSLSPPQNQSDEIAALKREIQTLKAQQASMQRDLDMIKSLLQSLVQARGQQPEEAFTDKLINITDAPTKGNQSAKVTLVEVSDYHCPYCRRQNLQTMPQLNAEYVNTGKVKYVFIDYPIAQLHPDAFLSHEAAACAGDQGKYWQMHDLLFTNSPAKDVSQLTANAGMIGVDTQKFEDCLNGGKGGKHAAAIRQSIGRMQQLGVGGTPLVLIGLTPAPGSPMKVVSFVYGAKPYPEFKAALDDVLGQAR